MKQTSILLITALILGGCAGVPVVPQAMLDQENSCFESIALAEMEKAKQNQTVQKMTFTDERNYVMVVAIEALARNNQAQTISPFMPCTATVAAYLQEAGMNGRSNNQILGKVVGATAIIGGIWATGNVLEGLVTSGGNTINGSRVIQQDNVVNYQGSSTSGEGLGVGNTFGSDGSLSGVQPRGNIFRDAGEDINTGSNSGDNSAQNPNITTPFQPQN
jgi:hypothetical protein